MNRPASMKTHKRLRNSFLSSRKSLQLDANHLLQKPKPVLSKLERQQRSQSGHLYNSKERMILTKSSYILKTPLIDELRHPSVVDKIQWQTNVNNLLQRRTSSSRKFRLKHSLVPEQTVPEYLQQVCWTDRGPVRKEDRPTNLRRSRKDEQHEEKRSIVNKDFSMEKHPMLLKKIMFKLRRYEK